METLISLDNLSRFAGNLKKQNIATHLVDTQSAGTEQNFTFRQSGGDGVANYKTIKGRTLKWNQLFSVPTQTVNNVTLTNNGDGSYKLSGSGVADFFLSGDIIEGRIGHKVYLRFKSDDTNVKLWTSWSSTIVPRETDVEVLFTAPQASGSVDIIPENAFNNNNATCYLNVIDLTDMFGDGYEPNTIVEFKSLYNAAYYAFNSGTLLPFKGHALKVTGFNQWDEEWRNGYYKNDGTYIEDSSMICNLSPIMVIKGSSYYFKGNNTYGNFGIFEYDANGTFLRKQSNINNIVTFLQDTVYINFHHSETTYNHNICINISNPARNGQYEPYQENTLNIDAIDKSAKDGDGNAIVPFPTGVNGVGGNNDWYGKENGAVRIFEVDASQLSWTLRSTGTNNKAWSATVSKQYIYNNGLSDRYTFGGTTTGSTIEINGADSYPKDYFYTFTSNDRTIYVITGVNDTPQGKIQLVRSTPVPFTWDTPLDTYLPVDELGTEKLLPEGVDTNGVPKTAPFRADTTYSISIANLVRKLNALSNE